MSDRPIETRRRVAIRYCASRRAAGRWALNAAVTLTALVALVMAGVRDGSDLALALTGFVVALGVPLSLLVVYRLLLEAGIAPRAYVRWSGDEAQLWTVASRITRRVVVGRRGEPIMVTRHYHTKRGVLGGSTGDWAILADGTTRVAMTVYSYREAGALEGLVAAILATGIPAEESAPIGHR